MMAASQAGSKGKVKGEVGSCGRFRRVWSSPWDAPSPSVLDAALLRHTSTSSAQLFHVDFTKQLSTHAAGCVPPKMTGSWWIQRWCATRGRALAALHFHRSINVFPLLKHQKQTDPLNT